MTRKRAIKLLMSVNRSGERTAVQDVMRLPQFQGKTNAEKVDDILLNFAFFAMLDGSSFNAFRAMNLRERLNGGWRK